jgi:hypothetical protein
MPVGKQGARLTNSAIRRSTGAPVAEHFVAIGSAASVAPAHGDPVYDQKFLDYLNQDGAPNKNRTEIIRVAKQFCLCLSRQVGSTWKGPDTTSPRLSIGQRRRPRTSFRRRFRRAVLTSGVERPLPFSCQRVRSLLLFRYRQSCPFSDIPLTCRTAGQLQDNTTAQQSEVR